MTALPATSPGVGVAWTVATVSGELGRVWGWVTGAMVIGDVPSRTYGLHAPG
ncbi:hypothetical protein PSN01_04192 [Micromonospora saelicesensis]|nr:hypothetical protein PSN01_04192 [Micromonospora saelicesensis]